MAELQLAEGHPIFIVRVRADASDTDASVEERVVQWFADALGVEASRRSDAGEYVIGAANPVSVFPMLGMTDAEFAEREARLCQGDASPFLGFVPLGPAAGAIVHVDWRGVETTLPTRWRETLTGWEPLTGAEAPDLAITTACFRPEGTRPPIEPPGFLDDLRDDLPEPPEFPDFLKRPSTWIGAAAVAVVGFGLWRVWKHGPK